MDTLKIIDIIKQFAGNITIIEIICLAGVLLFGIWLLKTSLGRNALADSMPRRNNMPFYLPFIPLFVWLGSVSVAIAITRSLMRDLPDWQSAFLDNLVLCIGGLMTVVVIIFLARAGFARRLKGFGLNPKTIHKDFFAGIMNLLVVYPLLIVAITLTTYFGQLIWGLEFEMQQHQELELITAHPQLPLRILIIVTAVVIAPVIEELLFRGLLQTMIRSFLSDFGFQISNFRCRQSAWLSIIISSGLFAMVHQDQGHWPALFVLGLCLGYAYEKSGSLFRPIFIHSLFNATTIIATLNQ